MTFTYPVYIPSVDQFISFREILNKHYVVLLKFYTNNDYNGVERYINQLIDHLNDDITHEKLNKVDKLCIMLTARIMCIGPDLELTLVCEKTNKQYTGRLMLDEILQRVSDLQLIKQQEYTFMNNHKIHAGVPNNLWCGESIDVLDSLSDVVTGLTINDTYHDMSDMTIQQKNSIINTIPGTSFNHIMKLANKTHESFNDLIIFEDKNPHDENAQVKEYRLGLYDNSMFDLVKLSFSANLHDYYINMFSLCDTMGFTGDYIQNITPVESDLFIKTKRQEIERQQSNKNNQQPTIGRGMPSGF